MLYTWLITGPSLHRMHVCSLIDQFRGTHHQGHSFPYDVIRIKPSAFGALKDLSCPEVHPAISPK